MLKKEELDKIKSMGALCELKLTYNEEYDVYQAPFINGVELDYNDFGEKYDTCRETACEYGCGNMQFIPYEKVDKKVLEKYNITEEEARQIQEKLDCLSFGSCGWCV